MSHTSSKDLIRNFSENSNIKPISYQLSAMRIQGLTRASGNQRIVLCLHGWLDNAASFFPLLSCLDDNNIIAIDWPGHGYSGHRSAGAHYHFFDYVYDLLELFESNQWENVDIVGHSMGGMIGSAFAAAFPEKVRSLTLIDALGFIYSDEEKATEQLRLAMISRLKNNQSADRNKTRYFSKETAVKARLSVSDLTDRDASLLVDRSLLQKGEEFCWRSDNKLRTLSPYRLTLGQARQLMKDIECPVKLIYATKGLKMIQEYLPLAEQLIKSFSAETLVGGHHIHMEQPIEVAKIIKHFLLDT